METVKSIPTSKLQRASKLIQTGAKVGVNYVKYQVDKRVEGETSAKEKFDQNNAQDIYKSLKNLKGSALKVAQMLSMDKNILPQAYVEQFSLAQFSVPPLSAPLVNKTFKKYFGQTPQSLFSEFNTHAAHAASIGQVHRARSGSKELAVKIQYPGVAESVSSDLALVKPMALKLLNLKAKESETYFKEVENKLLEETNYHLELEQGQWIAKSCQHLKNIRFPKYYPKWSSEKIITMDWMEGLHLSEWALGDHSKQSRNQVAQALWDFYMVQIHQLKKVNADPHPGNFLVTTENELVAIDFGCMKEIPDEFYNPYFELAKNSNLENPNVLKQKMFELEMIKESDSSEDQKLVIDVFYQLLKIFTQPFNSHKFDFSNEKFFQDIASLTEEFSKNSQLKKMDTTRGSKHFIYMNRTFFGLYNLLHMLQADEVEIGSYF